MSDDLARFHVAPLYRLQWEEVQKAWVLLYPEGIVKLNNSAGEILKRLDTHKTVRQLIDELEQDFQQSNLSTDVFDFLTIASRQGWVRRVQSESTSWTQ